MKSLGWALIQYDWYPYKKGKFRYRVSNAQKEEDAKTHGEKMAIYKPTTEAWNRPVSTSSMLRVLAQVSHPLWPWVPSTVSCEHQGDSEKRMK